MRLTRSFDWRGRTIAWEAVGTGPPVVMCHGTPWSSALWAPYAEAFARDFTVYLWDMPGYGQSSMRADHAVDLGVQGEAFAALLRHWDLPRPQVVAHDYGGAVSLRAHLLHDTAYRSLALVDVVALRPWGSPFFRLVKENAGLFTAQPPTVHRGALEAYIGTASHRGLTAGQLRTLTSPWLTAAGQQAFYRQIAAADERFTDEIQGRYGELDLPVKVVWGREDSWIPVDRGVALADAVTGAELDVVDDAGHLVQYDAPVRLATSLYRWLVATS
ncbi:MAG: alpha/beta fold hydrolase [Streptosporangiales bacterium]|nr:alpha/beta fold hydrolase [Streptosporangiales bacterium]MBO0889570.1 alpha/beta fold hydrolase [Acidothermales bacterium]